MTIIKQFDYNNNFILSSCINYNCKLDESSVIQLKHNATYTIIIFKAWIFDTRFK